jgi:multimeric flavodoxin WrbA
MLVIAVNGSPRKKWNTATLLRKVLEGAKARGAKTELVHLYDLDYSGCVSCFSCKKIGGKSYGRCAVKDGLRPLLERVREEAAALVLGSPMYFHTETGAMRCCLERLLFPSLTYTPGYASIFPRPLPSALVYTMNVSEAVLAGHPQAKTMAATQATMVRAFGSCEVLSVTDTYQFTDYSKYLSTAWDAEAKAKRRAEVFPQDCAKAQELGARLVEQARAGQPG